MLKQILSGIFLSVALLSQSLQANTAWTVYPTPISSGTLPVIDSQAANDIDFDGFGNAAAIWTENDGIVNQIFTSTYDSGTDTWSPAFQLDATLDNGLYPQIEVNQAGTGLAIWLLTIGNVLYYSTNTDIVSGAWAGELGLSNSGNVDPAFPPSLSQAETADFAVAVWSETPALSPETVQAAIYTGGAWPVLSDTLSSTAVGEVATQANVSVNNAGQAIAVWSQNSSGTISVQSSFYTGGAWSGAVDVSIPAATSVVSPLVGLAANGTARAIWLDSATATIRASIFNGTTWSTPTILSAAGASEPSLAVNSNGLAYASWTLGGVIQAAFFNGTTWGTPQSIVAGANESGSQVAINASGHGIVVFNTGSGANVALYSSFISLGGSWQTPVLVQDSTLANIFPAVAINSVNQVITSWSQYAGVAGVTRAAIGANTDNIGPANASSFIGFITENKFINGKEWVSQLFWTPSPDPTVIGYNLYRNGILIFKSSASGPFSYNDFGRSYVVPDVYVLKSFNSFGVESSGLTVTLP